MYLRIFKRIYVYMFKYIVRINKQNNTYNEYLYQLKKYVLKSTDKDMLEILRKNVSFSQLLHSLPAASRWT